MPVVSLQTLDEYSISSYLIVLKPSRFLSVLSYLLFEKLASQHRAYVVGTDEILELDSCTNSGIVTLLC